MMKRAKKRITILFSKHWKHLIWIELIWLMKSNFFSYLAHNKISMLYIFLNSFEKEWKRRNVPNEFVNSDFWLNRFLFTSMGTISSNSFERRIKYISCCTLAASLTSIVSSQFLRLAKCHMYNRLFVICLDKIRSGEFRVRMSRRHKNRRFRFPSKATGYLAFRAERHRPPYLHGVHKLNENNKIISSQYTNS